LTRPLITWRGGAATKGILLNHVPSEATSAIGANEREWALIRQCSRDGYGAGK
jgi:hypothetical protein